MRSPQFCRPLMLIVSICLWSGITATAWGFDEAAEQNRQRIAAMSETNRQNLARNFQRYKALTPAEREHLQEIHAELLKNEKEGGNLRNVARQYHEWLKTLDINQRVELANETDPLKKQALVTKYRQEQEQRILVGLARRRPGDGRRDWPPFRGVQLSDADLTSVMQALERQLFQVKAIDETQNAQLQQARGFHRYVLVLELLAARTVEAPGQPRYTPEMFDAMVAAISNEEHRTFVLDKSPQWQRPIFVGMLARAIFDRLQLELEQKPEGGATLESLMASLTPEQRADVEKLPEDQRKFRLFGVYSEKVFRLLQRAGAVGERGRGFGRPPGRNDERGPEEPGNGPPSGRGEGRGEGGFRGPPRGERE